jgi:hypothetical protein
VVAFNGTLLTSLVFIESARGVGNRGPALLDSINVNGLVVFLVVIIKKNGRKGKKKNDRDQ